MDRLRERLFVLLFTISFLININQCSDKSDDFEHSAEMTKIELSGVKKELGILKEEINRLSSLLSKNKEQTVIKAEPPVSNKKVNRVVIDSVATKPVPDETVDSVKVN